jgi:hypothetical protein
MISNLPYPDIVAYKLVRQVKGKNAKNMKNNIIKYTTKRVIEKHNC